MIIFYFPLPNQAAAWFSLPPPSSIIMKLVLAIVMLMLAITVKVEPL